MHFFNNYKVQTDVFINNSDRDGIILIMLLQTLKKQKKTKQLFFVSSLPR